MKKLHLEGRTVQSCDYIDAYDGGVVITFTCGAVLKIREAMQAGELKVTVNGNEVDRPERE